MAVGLSLSVGIGDETGDLSEYRFMAIPHYRVYFGKKRAAGFFIEGSAAIASVRNDYKIYYDGITDSYYSAKNGTDKTSFGLGAAVGAKFLTRNGFLGEVFGGVGRLFGETGGVEAYPRIGISLGKRF